MMAHLTRHLEPRVGATIEILAPTNTPQAGEWLGPYIIVARATIEDPDYPRRQYAAKFGNPHDEHHDLDALTWCEWDRLTVRDATP